MSDITLISSRQHADAELKAAFSQRAPERVPSNLVPLWQAAMLIEHYLADDEMQQRIHWRTAAQFLHDQICTAIEIRRKDDPGVK